MLVLSRRRREKLVIGENIEIVVLEITSDGVKLGVNAPNEVPIYRGELYEQIANQNRAAARPNAREARTDSVLALLRKRRNRTPV